MSLNYSKDKLALVGLIGFCLIYIFALLINTHLAPTDDFIFLRTLQSGKPLLYYSADFPYYETAKIGRFTPLAGMEYNLIGLFSKSPLPFWYYFLHTIEFVLFIILFIKILKKFTSNKTLIYLATAVLTLIPGFTFTYFRLQMVERNMLFFMAVFIIYYLTYIKNQRWYYFWGTLISANIVLYLKETSFIMIGAFALFHLIFSRKEKNSNIKKLDYVILLSSVLYVVIYYFYIFLPFKGFLTYGKNALPFYIAFIQKLLNYTFVNDPLIILVIFPLIILRLYRILIKREEPSAVFDSMLFAAALFIIAYLIINVPSAYYFLPAYALILPAFFYFFKDIHNIKIFKILLFVAVFLIIFNSVPLGIHYITYYKYMPSNFNKTLDFMIAQIKTKNQDSRVNIFLDGMNKGSSNWNYFIFSEFLLNRGLTQKQFDLRASLEDEKKPKFQPLPIAMPKISLPYSVFQSNGPAQTEPGDYLIVSPLNTDFSKKHSGDKNYLKKLEKDYDLIFQTNSRYQFPMLTLKELSRYLLFKFAKSNKKFLTMDIREPNLESPDFYVFIKK